MSRNVRRKRGATWCDKSLVLSPVYIGICTTAAQYRRECEAFSVAPDAEWVPSDAHAICRTLQHEESGKVACLICVPPRGRRSRAEYAALIVHEAAHVWQQVRQSIGESQPSSEFEAYSLQSICQRLFEAVKL